MSPAQRIPKILALVLFLAVVTVIFTFMYTRLAGGRLPGVSSSEYRVSALIDEPLQLVTGSEVRSAGIRVGEVVDSRGQGGRSLITMNLRPGYRHVYRDAHVQTRLRTLLGESYVELEPGTPDAGRIEEGGMLPAEASQETVPLDKILNTLDPKTRDAVSATLRGLGTGVDGRGSALNRALASLSQGVDVGRPVLAELHAQRSDLASLIDDGGKVMKAISRRDVQVRQLIRATRRTAEAVASRDESLNQAIRTLPGALRQVKQTVGGVQTLADDATPVADHLTTAAAALEPVMRELPATAFDARRLVERLPSALDATDPLLTELPPVSRAGVPALDALAPALRQAVPMLTYLAPYRRDLGASAANMGSMFAFYPPPPGAEPEGPDHNGPHSEVASGRVQLMANVASLGQTTPQMRKLEDALLREGLLAKVGGLRTNAYPPPGTADAPPPSDGRYTRVQPLRSK